MGKKEMPPSSNRESKKLISTSDEGSERTCVSYNPSEKSITVSPSKRNKKSISSSPDKKSKKPSPSYSVEAFINKKSKKPSSSTKSTKRMPKKSTSALPINIRNDDQASLPENIQVKSSPNAKRSRKIPNSRKKKKSSPMFGVLNQK